MAENLTEGVSTTQRDADFVKDPEDVGPMFAAAAASSSGERPVLHLDDEDEEEEEEEEELLAPGSSSSVGEVAEDSSPESQANHPLIALDGEPSLAAVGGDASENPEENRGLYPSSSSSSHHLPHFPEASAPVEADSSSSSFAPNVFSKNEPVSEPESSEPESLAKSWSEPKTGTREITATLEDAWLKNIDPKVEEESEELAGFQLLDLIYWRDVGKTGVVFGSMLFILLSLAFFSMLSVVAYLSLAILAVTLSFRVYKNVLQAVQKSGDGHPFREYLEMDIELPEPKVQKAVQNVLKHVNATVKELRRLFLVADLVDSIKFGLLLWVLTYIGSWFNGITLTIIIVVTIFTLPKIYETYKVQIDNYLAMARTQFNRIFQQIQSKLPFLKKKVKTQ